MDTITNGTKVVLLTDEYAPWVSKGAIGEIYDYESDFVNGVWIGDEQYVDFDWDAKDSRHDQVYLVPKPK